MKKTAKKAVLILCTLVMAVSLFVGCGNDKDGNVSPSPAATVAPTVTTTPEASPAETSPSPAATQLPTTPDTTPAS